MGVPKFYRWISERYPCLSEIVTENQIPEFDNLYLDMNGIIHACSHPNDEDPHFRITEEQIFRDIFRYIEVLFRIIRPRNVFYMAVDGVAPRAKMNQQRGRRFMSARTAKELIEKAKRNGEQLPSAERFDSNCITPGTVFMARLHEQLKYFVNMKITTDEMWQGIRIYLSGHDVPGEGEHKIMDFIRYERSQPGYNYSTRHCLYGLDADLIMLGICSHEPYFCLLREEVKFVRPSKKGNVRTANAEQTTFHLLHLSLLRDYIELEFSSVKEHLSFDFDLESIIDDWVLMGFLVGNDFIPHLPNLHIHADALPTLYKVYKKVLPELGGHINESGYLNLPRLEKFMATLSQFDRDFFQDEYGDLMWLESKKNAGGVSFPSRDIRRNVPKVVYAPKALVPYQDSDSDVLVESSNSDNPLSPDDGATADRKPEEIVDNGDYDDSDEISHMSQELQDLIRRSNAGLKNSESSTEEEPIDVATDIVTTSGSVPVVDYEACGDDDEGDDSWSPEMERKFRTHKNSYYADKMSFAHVTPEVLHDQAVQYVRALQWNLHYYYNGICSWSWYYPHHYTPYLSDVKGFSNIKIEFELGEPFLPFQQLLGVLPSASKKLLPSAYQALMVDSQSPLIEFYPSDFETDLNGKKNDWEAVILIPFIKEDRLLNAMLPLGARLTDEEKARNMHGKHLLYTTAAKDQGFYRSSLVGIFPDLEHNKAACTQVEADLFRLPPSKIRKGLLPGIRLDLYFLGFSTLKHLPYTGELTALGVKVFQQNSRNESVLIKLLDNSRCQQALPDLVDRLMGKEVYVNWPHLFAGLVSAVVADGEKYVKEKGDDCIKRIELNSKEQKMLEDVAEEIKTKYYEHRAVAIGKVEVLVYINRLMGKRYLCNQRGQISLEKQWSDVAVPYALQTVVENVHLHDSVAARQYNSVDELFPVGTKVFLISNPFYGSEGIVVQAFDGEKCRFRVEVTVKAEPDFSRLIANQDRIGLFWYPGWQAAQKLDISGRLLGRITGTVYVNEVSPSGSNSSGNRYNIGLNLKFSKKNEEVPDYTRRDGDGVWLYSSKVLKILDDYYHRFPEVFEYLHGNDGGKDVFEAENFWTPQDSKEKLKELVDWLKTLPCHGLQHQAAGTETIDERVIRVIEQTVDKTNALRRVEEKLLGVRPNALFRACLSEGSSAPDSNAEYQLYDRVVCAREGYTVPVGLRGTVVGIHPGRQEGDMKLSVIFDAEFVGGVNIRNSRCSGYHIASSALINLSYGVRIAEVKRNEKQTVLLAQQQNMWNHGPAVSAQKDERVFYAQGRQWQQQQQQQQFSREAERNHYAQRRQSENPNYGYAAAAGPIRLLSRGEQSTYPVVERMTADAPRREQHLQQRPVVNMVNVPVREQHSQRPVMYMGNAPGREQHSQRPVSHMDNVGGREQRWQTPAILRMDNVVAHEQLMQHSQRPVLHKSASVAEDSSATALQFVPMQVTKKQPAPAYVKGIGTKAGANNAQYRETRPAAAENRSIRDAGYSRVDNSENVAAVPGRTKTSEVRQQQHASGARTSTKPKSRLAIKLTTASGAVN